MTRTRKAVAGQEGETEQLTAAVNRLADELGVLRQVLDEFRAVFAWAVRNDKLGPSDTQQIATQLLDSSDGGAPELDDDRR